LLLTLIIFFVRTDLCEHKRREVTGNGKNFESFCFSRSYSSDKLEEDEMDEACGTYAGKKSPRGFGGDTCRKETDLKK
jgi:hypothetical protein